MGYEFGLTNLRRGVMNVFFRPEELKNRQKGYTFDDVLIVPCHSEVLSRGAPQTTTKITKKFQIKVPLISANMDTITELEMAKAMAKMGGIGIIHRFMDIEKQVNQILELKSVLKNNPKHTQYIAASIGVKPEDIDRAKKLVEAGVDILTIDIAHGDSTMMITTLRQIKKSFPQTDVIAGNVATPQGAKTLIENGADAIKVGIGPGSMCTTRIITGCGVPQLTAIRLCVEECNKYNVPVIADGGLRTSGDIVKAFAVGASTVMLGSMLSGTFETPGEIHHGKKTYRGMASKSAQVSWRGEMPQGMAPEGETTTVNCKGPVEEVVSEILGGIRSGMSYCNANNLQDIEKNVHFVEMTAAGVLESRAHGIRN